MGVFLKKLIGMAAAFTLLASTAFAQSAGPYPFGLNQGENVADYVLTFDQEFDTPLDTTTWSAGTYPYSINSGSYSYSPPSDDPNTALDYQVSDSSLKIWPVKDSNGNWAPRELVTDRTTWISPYGYYKYSNAGTGGFFQEYGYIEIEAKLPKGKGLIPYFSLRNHDNVTSMGNYRVPEIALLRAFTGRADYMDSYNPTAYDVNVDLEWVPWCSSPPYSYSDCNLPIINAKIQSSDLSADFHKYAVRWDPNQFTYYLDGQKVATKSMPSVLSDPNGQYRSYYHRQMYISLGLGYDTSQGDANPDDSTPTGEGNSFEINYIRVWKTNAADASTFKTGIHAHRLYNNGGYDGIYDAPPSFQYGLVRDWDIERTHDFEIWNQDSSDPDGFTIDFSTVDQVYNQHGTWNGTVSAVQGAKVIKTFATVPTWAAKRPGEDNPSYPDNRGGLSGPANLDQYEKYVSRFVTHTQNYLWAVEGWNEPYPCTYVSPGDPDQQFTTMTPTELADVQKRIYQATKAVNPNILVLSPAQAYVCGIENAILTATTSEGEPITNFFDVLAWHAYNRQAFGNPDPQYPTDYETEVTTLRNYLKEAAIAQNKPQLANMPLIDTEHGWIQGGKEGGDEFAALSSDGKGQVLYDTAEIAKRNGVLGIVWYSYDDDLIGNPSTDSVISDHLQDIYTDFNMQ